MMGRQPGMTFEQRESRRYAYCWHVGKRRCLAFPTPRIDSKSATEQISANWEPRGPTQVRQMV